MQGLLIYISVAYGTFSPEDDGFGFEFDGFDLSGDGAFSGGYAQYPSVPPFPDLSDRDMAWLELEMWNEIGPDFLHSVEAYPADQPELSIQIPEILPVESSTDQPVEVTDAPNTSTGTPMTTLPSPSKRGRGRPPKHAFKTVTTRKPYERKKTSKSPKMGPTNEPI